MTFFYKLILNYIKHINDITKLGTAICGIQKFSKVRGEYKKEQNATTLHVNVIHALHVAAIFCSIYQDEDGVVQKLERFSNFDFKFFIS